MVRRLEFVGGNSAKFWEVSRAGAVVTVRYGRLGAAGQKQSKLLPDIVAAERHVEKLVSQKLTKGYLETVVA